MKAFVFGCLLLIALRSTAQELYVFSEPASNMPAAAFGLKTSSYLIAPQLPYDRFMQRHLVETQFGLSRKLMVHAGAGFADMHTDHFRWESAYLYAKYRFLSKDQAHSHFRMAAFAEGSYTRSQFHFDEVSLNGDKSGVQAGLIATQLIHKLALSATLSHTQVLHKDRGSERMVYLPSRIYQVMGYSLSAGYLLLPVEYTDYRQTNLNFYLELLGQQGLDRDAHYVDLAPALQLIFNSNFKVNLGYRFQLGSDMERMSRNQFLISFERTFLNALRSE